MAVAGSAIAGLQDRAGSKKVIKSIARKQVQKLAPELTVKRAAAAGRADSAATADTAASAETSNSAKTADVATRADSAGLADSAAKVGGLEVKEISYLTDEQDGVVSSILNFKNFFRIDAQCSTGGDRLDLTAFTAIDHSTLTMISTLGTTADDTNAVRDIRSEGDFDFNANEAFPIDNNLAQGSIGPLGSRQATIQFATPDGFTATVQLQTLLLLDRPHCRVTGTAIGG
jgi:hypothetical protein